MESIIYIERSTKKRCKELVYGAAFLHFLYGNRFLNRTLGRSLAYLLARIPFVSFFYGVLQRSSWSVKKIVPFIKKFQIDSSEFVKNPSEFISFDDFFTRKLKSYARPIVNDLDRACIPADGRYLFYQRLDQVNDFIVKGGTFNLEKLLRSAELAEKYAKGSMVIARLCPSDYHRFHFPADCTPGETQPINGWLNSVNPLAIKTNVKIFWENKRTLCTLDTPVFGKVLYLEIGAIMVGAMHQTYTPFQSYSKGDEKGFFSFGASSLILIFPPETIRFDQDLVEATAQGLEILCHMGQSMGKVS